MTYENFLTSLTQSEPPSLTPPLHALWLCRNDQWEAAHNIAQDLHTPAGSWIHALLHLIEGDTSNADYWFHRAQKPTRSIKEIDQEWHNIARSLCDA
jgi:hypothetical protein